MSRTPIRVLLVDDSPLALVILQRLLASSPDIEVVGVATHGRQALDLIPLLCPAIVCIDYHMPDMNGLELTQEIMARFPCPILVISSAVGEAEADRIFTLLDAGAVDVFPKPKRGPDDDSLISEQLVKKIKIVAGVRVHLRRKKSFLTSKSDQSLILPSEFASNPQGVPGILAIGASTGGPQAIQTILTNLPSNFPIPIVCVQHISDGFLDGLVSWLGTHYKGKIKVAEPDEIPLPGNVYFPKENTHLVIDRTGRFQASLGAPLGRHRPSVNATFFSVAERYRDKAIGVLLTGMGHDGGEGMQALARAGAFTICQDEATSVIFGMPKDAIDRGAARKVLPLSEIANAIADQVIPTNMPGKERISNRKK